MLAFPGVWGWWAVQVLNLWPSRCKREIIHKKRAFPRIGGRMERESMANILASAVQFLSSAPRMIPAQKEVEMYEIPEIECDTCSGCGEIVTDWGRYLHPLPGDKGGEAVAECPDCDGGGWRPMTPDEINDAAADAYSDMCEGEPPMSFAERTAMQARRDAELGVR